MSEDTEQQQQLPRRKPYRGWVFLAVVCGFYLLVYWLFPQFGGASIDRFGKMVVELGPVFLLVFFFLWATELFSGTTRKLAELTGEGSGVSGWVIAIVAGVLSHGPIYPWYALLKNMREHGMRVALVAAFLYARAIKLPWLPLMAFYFGSAYMVVLTFWVLVFAVLHGWLIEWLLGETSASGTG